MLIADLCGPQVAEPMRGILNAFAANVLAEIKHGQEFGPEWDEAHRLDIIRARELTAQARKERGK